MAKITARGDRELDRWNGPDGRVAVFTAHGRILWKWSRGATFTVAGRNKTRADFDDFVEGRKRAFA